MYMVQTQKMFGWKSNCGSDEGWSTLSEAIAYALKEYKNHQYVRIKDKNGKVVWEKQVIVPNRYISFILYEFMV